MKILNLTQHMATAEQVAAGVFESEKKLLIQGHLTFDTIPCPRLLADRAAMLAHVARTCGADAVMIGGAPFFMAPLEAALKKAGVKFLYAFSMRESVDVPQADGSVRKTQVFRHAGFVDPSGDTLSPLLFSTSMVVC